MNALRSHLSENKIRQTEFAEAIGVNQATVSKLCGDDPGISFDLAVKIEQVTGGAVQVSDWPQFAKLRDLANTGGSALDQGVEEATG